MYNYGFIIYSDLFGNFDWTIEKAKEHNMYEWPRSLPRNYLKSMDDNSYHFQLDYTRLLNEFD